MAFQISFQPARPSVDHRTADDGPCITDDRQAMIIQACALLAEVNGSHFHFHGFGREPWHVDIAYDLSAVLEQLKEVVDALRARRSASLDLYTQGLECDLDFVPYGERVQIRCRSRTEWVPAPAEEVIDRVALLGMLTGLARQVACGLKMVDSRLVFLAPFDAWTRGEL